MVNDNQDDERELILIEKFNLIRNGKNSRDLYDALDQSGNIFELKSTSKKSVSTARDCGFQHLKRWRNEYWIIGTWDCSYKAYNNIFFLSPTHLEEWFVKVENTLLQRKCLIDEIQEKMVFNPKQQTLFNSISKRGCSLNDPSIPLSYIFKKGKPINNRDDLDYYIKKYPIINNEEKENITLFDFL